MPALLALAALWLAARPMMPLSPLPTLVYDPTLDTGAPGDPDPEPPPPGTDLLDLGTDYGVTLALAMGML